MSDKYAYFKQALKKREEQKSFQEMRATLASPNDDLLVNFASDDVLGLTKHPFVKKHTIKYVLSWGTQEGAEHSREQHRIEAILAKLTGFEKALFFNTPYQAVTTILSHITKQDTLVFVDRSYPANLTKMLKGKVIRFERGHPTHLANLLQKNRMSTSKLVVTEAVSSIEGESADMIQFVKLCRENHALLFVDETSSNCALGQFGMGLSAHRKGVDFTVGSFPKGLGAYGACSKLMYEYLKAFSTGPDLLPPAMLGGIDAILQLIPDMDAERRRVKQRAIDLRAELKHLGLSTGGSNTHIVPIILGKSETVQDISNMLKKNHILCSTIVPPISPVGKARLRLTLTVDHGPKEIESLLSLLEKTL
ncbi:MAG: 8-amino-7-oxononanoate synthase [Chlamydiia bacterium]|nr:8-amino-7-oxononanoate synthase [Chlamydiia bacterium]MCH9614975.1 8-amino-7-oxononanoate synthase [Chlamydiia bacterium]MCH9629975.1 8-amino-7-oxononanoate synthase [Chlamydiia bacterium]